MISRLSSPPTRGSSIHLDIASGAKAVVPARAGIFRPPERAARRRSRRPRPRGDLPVGIQVRHTGHGSSPPARGSSHPERHELGRHPVVPARAGIFPGRPWTTHAPPSRPRTRGDLPRLGFLAGGMGASSPPARGSSPSQLLNCSPQGVVPARAGIFPAHRSSRSARVGRPRPRGDLPWAIGEASDRPTSSPPARGSSRALRIVVAAHIVVPARAGIFRKTPTPRP